MAVVTKFNYALENRLIKKLDLMTDRCSRDKPVRDAWMINEGGEGEGKCWKKGTKILMADGSWKNVEDILEGDEVISPQEDGTNVFSKVIGLSNWFCNETYDVVQLNKTQKKLYTCSNNHPIPINIKRNHQKGTWKIENVEAKDYSRYSQSLKRNSTSLSSFEIDKFKGQTNCQIEPYTLGVYLGDGSFTRALTISHSNLDVMNEVLKFYDGTLVNCKTRKAKQYRFSLNGDLAKQLISLGLRGNGSGTKFIPKEALLSDAEYRIRLLAGLIDTDCHYYHGGYNFVSKSLRMINDIKSLIYSLGGRTGEIREIKKKIKSINFEGTYYALCGYLGDMSLPIKKKYKTKDNGTFYLSPNRISVDVIPSKSCQVYGFTIDSPSHWCITNGWMITHNTNSSIAEAYYVHSKTNRPIHLEFRLKQLIDLAKAKKRLILIWDEPAFDSMKSDVNNRLNKDLMRLLQTCRMMQHFLIINMTRFYRFNESIIVDRCLGMVHMYSRNEIEPGRFCYIKKKRLESLYRGYTSKHLREYKQNSSFRGDFPEVMDNYFEKMGIIINGKQNCTLADYNKFKSEAIGSIGDEEKPASGREAQIRRSLNKLRFQVSLLPKKLEINQEIVASRLGISSTRLREWEKIDPVTISA